LREASAARQCGGKSQELSCLPGCHFAVGCGLGWIFKPKGFALGEALAAAAGAAVLAAAEGVAAALLLQGLYFGAADDDGAAAGAVALGLQPPSESAATAIPKVTNDSFIFNTLWLVKPTWSKSPGNKRESRHPTVPDK
jgi:hypothetical protein